MMNAGRMDASRVMKTYKYALCAAAFAVACSPALVLLCMFA